MRKDRVSSSAKSQCRVYLDNFDLVERLDPATAATLEGQVADTVLELREQYAVQNIPRHPKKAAVRSPVAEIQGAIVDGVAGFAQPKASKIVLYCQLALMLVQQERCTLKELQVVCGGFVYFAMFRRPLLSALNDVWRFMEKLKRLPPVVRLPVPPEVKRELLLFILLTPLAALAQIDFRSPFVEHVTCSDASTTGGGICVSEGLTGYGVAALQILMVGLFDGLNALRLAVDSLGVGVEGHLSVEKEGTGRRVVEAFFPDTIFHDDVRTVDSELEKGLYSDALPISGHDPHWRWSALPGGERPQRLQERCIAGCPELPLPRSATHSGSFQGVLSMGPSASSDGISGLDV